MKEAQSTMVGPLLSATSDRVLIEYQTPKIQAGAIGGHGGRGKMDYLGWELFTWLIVVPFVFFAAAIFVWWVTVDHLDYSGRIALAEWRCTITRGLFVVVVLLIVARAVVIYFR